MWSTKVTAACHKRSTYVRPCVPHTWNCVFHLRGTVCSTYVELCVPSTWNCVFHIRGIAYPTYVRRCFIYVEPSVPPIGTVSSIYWNCAFHILELCVPKHGTLLEHCECCRRGRHRARFAACGASFCERRLKAERRSYKRAMHVSNPYAEAHGGRDPCTCREPT